MAKGGTVVGEAYGGLNGQTAKKKPPSRMGRSGLSKPAVAIIYLNNRSTRPVRT